MGRLFETPIAGPWLKRALDYFLREPCLLIFFSLVQDDFIFSVQPLMGLKGFTTDILLEFSLLFNYFD